MEKKNIFEKIDKIKHALILQKELEEHNNKLKKYNYEKYGILFCDCMEKHILLAIEHMKQNNLFEHTIILDSPNYKEIKQIYDHEIFGCENIYNDFLEHISALGYTVKLLFPYKCIDEQNNLNRSCKKQRIESINIDTIQMKLCINNVNNNSNKNIFGNNLDFNNNYQKYFCIK